ncbi:CpsB/CapC family capsule biosynthesis tyrosine phosphatase [Gracilibacillus lacisalsi]|uniref:CpsB/CapC family capsule biosynthesis tyrosine phosphatase n=1 Tax=Gracilibacillus lacisalsi TaxID=393087 RepID=UPI000360C11C|nr:CpsB/CapC family capsule biosynthesis tyrosine phosphatase [Gracilibacillus lacisalsi]
MLDINPYILPINRESVTNISSSIAIAKQAEKANVRKIIAAPRYIQGKQEINKDTIINLVEKVNQQLMEENIDVEIIPGQTIRIYGNMEEDLETDSLITYGAEPKYVFMELMHDHIPEYTKQLCYELQLKGYKPVFMSPEKNLQIQDDHDHLYSMVKNGVLVQVSAKSIVGKKGKKLQKLTQQFLKNNLAHFVGSDTSEAKEYHLQSAWKSMKRNISFHQWYLLQENQNLLLDNKMVQGEEPERVKKKKIFGIL